MQKNSARPIASLSGAGFLRRSGVLLLLWAWFCELLAAGQPQNPSPYLTNAVQIRQLAPDIAQKNLPVRLRGVITYYDPPLYSLFFQDATAGIFVLMDTNHDSTLAAGQEVELEGVSSKGDYAPMIKAPVIHILGSGQWPIPQRVSFDQLATGQEDSQWVEVCGLVRAATASGDRFYLNLLMDGQRLMVSVRGLTTAEAAVLVNACVRVRGVCFSHFNLKRQLRSPWLAVSSRADVVVEKPSPGEPKEVALAGLSQFNSQGYYGRRLKVCGVVTLQKSDGSFFIQSGDAGLAVHADQAIKLALGDLVAVSGYTALGQYTPNLEDAVVQPLAPGALPMPVPVPVTLAALLDSPEAFEGVLVRVEAELMNRVEGSMGQTLVLQASNTIFTAHLEIPLADERVKSVKLGSTVALTGVFDVQAPGKWTPHLARARERIDPTFYVAPPESVQILLRSSSDITVLQAPSWWTLDRLLRMLGIMSFILLAGLTWVVVLDRRVRRQTQTIEEKIKREGVLEERDRIAREFHDTLEQELAAITIQLDAVEAQFDSAPETARRLLELARNMTRRSLSEARRSVWDLRSHLLENCSLPTALAEMAVPLAAATGVEITVLAAGNPWKLPAVTEHNLIRIAQEALANALKHSGAKKIRLALDYGSSQIQLRLRDDGRGFDPSAADQASGGHFGLLDMQERAEKIGACFTLTSQPGHGTEISINVNLNHA
jgi:signal transduction histidine kinase